MYQKVKLFFCFIPLFFIQPLSAQTFTLTIPPGNPPTNTVSLLPNNTEEARKPLGTYFGYERNAFIFAHTELGMYGQITSIAVFCDSVYNPGDVPLTIYAREVADSAFKQLTTVANEELGATLVYTGTIPATSFTKNQWITINFNTPFTHAAHNKAVEFIFETNAAIEGNTSGNEGLRGKFFAHYLPNSSYVSQYWDNDYSPPLLNGVTLSLYRPNVQVNINSIPACSGLPIAGTTTCVADTFCLNEPLVLSLNGNSIATGLTYQWQDSVSGSIAFTNITGADSTTLLTSINTTTWYRCAVICSGQTAYTTPKQITLRNFLNCYCTAGLGGGCDFNTAVDSVAIPGTTLANGLTGCSSPTYYTLYPYSGNTTAQLNRGSSYNLYTRYNGNVASSFWIDYNQNGLLENNEWKQICLQSPSPLDTIIVDGVVISNVDSLFITPFTVPLNAVIGKTLLRVRTVAGGNTNDTMTTCVSLLSGETEDYYVYINYPAGIEQYANSNNNLKVYPNPTASILNVELGIQNGATEIQVADILGNVLIHNSAFLTHNLTLDVGSLTDGVYFIEVLTTEKRLTQKFIIAK